MAYTKQNFEDGQVLTAEHLNTMETELAREKSWNELADKPFGEVTEYSDTLVSAVTSATLSSTVNVMGVFYKVSDSIVTLSDLANGCTAVLSGNTVSATADMFSSPIEGVVTDTDMTMMFVDEAGVGADMSGEGDTISEVGVYVNVNYVIGFQLTIPGYSFANTTVKQIEEKYLPVVALYAQNVDDVYTLYKDANFTEGLTNQELTSLRYKNASIVVWLDKLCLHPLETTDNYILLVRYIGTSTNNCKFLVCYTAEYTAEE